jgi:predicted Fe-Mo cluster-binding NifX family protein
VRVAVSIWEDEVSPVFDFAHNIVLVEWDQDHEVARYRYETPEKSMPSRMQRLREMGADVLLCGAISNLMAKMIQSSGITLIAWKCGDVEDVLSAYFSGAIDAPRFSMPGARNGSSVHIEGEKRKGGGL